MKKNDIWYRIAISGIALCFILLIIMLFNNISIDYDIQCDTGESGLIIDFDNYVQTYKCDDYEYKDKNLTCFKTDLLIKEFGVSGLKNLNCKAKGKATMPLIMGLKWL